MASEHDERFDYSEPEELPAKGFEYEESRPHEQGRRLPDLYGDEYRQSGGRGRYDRRERVPADSSTWSDGTKSYRPGSKQYDPFDYGDEESDDSRLPSAYERPVPSYERPVPSYERPASSYENRYDSLEEPPEGTYGNQWR